MGSTAPYHLSSCRRALLAEDSVWQKGLRAANSKAIGSEPTHRRVLVLMASGVANLFHTRALRGQRLRVGLQR